MVTEFFYGLDIVVDAGDTTVYKVPSFCLTREMANHESYKGEVYSAIRL